MRPSQRPHRESAKMLIGNRVSIAFLLISELVVLVVLVAGLTLLCVCCCWVSLCVCHCCAPCYVQPNYNVHGYGVY